MTEPCPEAFVDFAQRLADVNAAHVRKFFQNPMVVESKDDASPVTVADREGEEAMRRMIREAYPDHGILGEEFPPERADAEFVWVLDPIDGTAAFVAGMPTFGTLIALLHEGRSILGLIDAPALRERWIGAPGRPTTRNGRPVRARPCASLSQATLCSASPHYFDRSERQAFFRLVDRVRGHCYGTFCYGYGLLAAGIVDLVLDGGMSTHDYMPLVPVIAGAGGAIADWEGQELSPGSADRVIAAASRGLLEEALEVLALEAGP